MALPNVPITSESITFPWQQWAEKVDRTVTAARTGGSTSNRPRAKEAYLWMTYFDTTLGKPVWAKTISPTAVVWVDATGATV